MLQDAIGHQAKMLRMLGRLRDAVALWDALPMEYRSRGVPSVVAYAEDNQALVFKDLGDYERALGLHESAESFCRARAMRWELAKSLANKAILLFQKLHRLEAARIAAEEAIELWRGPRRRPGGSPALGRPVANVYRPVYIIWAPR